MFKDFKLIDLTHTLDEKIPTWTGDCGFRSKIIVDYADVARVLEFHCIASAGTHIDAPSHFIPNGRNVDQLRLEELCTPVCVVDMSAKLEASAQVTLKDFEQYENTHGKIPNGCIILAHTGWSRYWNNPEKYRGKEEYPVAPTIAPEAGDWLMERNIAGIGIDSFSIDPYGGSYPLHVLLLGADKFNLENLTRLDKLLKKGGYLIALPLKVAGGTESPIRAMGLIPSLS